MKSKEAIIEEAQEAFWNVIAANYPEVKDVNFSIDDTMKFHNACTEAVDTWIDGCVI